MLNFIKQFFIFFLVFLLVAVAALVSVPLFFSLESYRQEVVDTMKEVTGLNFVSRGTMRVSFFPTPSVVVVDSYVPNVKGASSAEFLSVQEIKMSSSFEMLLQGKLVVDEVTLVNPVLNVEAVLGQNSNLYDIVGSVKKDHSVGSVRLPSSVNIENGLVSYISSGKKSFLDYVNAEVSIGDNLGLVSVEGGFEREDAEFNFSLDIDGFSENSSAKLKLFSEHYEINIDTKRDQKTGLLKGNLSGQTSNIGKFGSSFFPESEVFLHLDSKEKAVFGGEFSLSNNLARLSNSKIESENISAVANIGAHINLGTSSISSWDIKVSAEKLNIDGLKKKEKAVDEGEVVDYYKMSKKHFSPLDYSFDVSRNLSMLFYLDVKEVVINKRKIRDVKVSLDAKDGRVVVKTLQATFPGESKFSLSGSAEHNGIRSLLDGKLEFSGKKLRQVVKWLYPEFSVVPKNLLNEFSIRTDIKLTPRNIVLSDMEFYFDRSLISGEFSLNKARELNYVKYELDFEDINLDRYNLTTLLLSSLGDLLGEVRDSEGDNWLKLYRDKSEGRLDFKNVKLNDNVVKKASFNFIVSPGLLNIQKAFVNSKKVRGNLKSLVKFKETGAGYNFELKADRFDTSFFATGKEDGVLDFWSWSEENFNFKGFEGLDGRSVVNITDFKHGPIALKNVRLDSQLYRSVFSVKDFTAKVAGGEVVAKGNIGVIQEAPTMAFSFAVSKVGLKDFVGIIDKDFSHGGKLYFNGKVKTSGNSPLKWALNADFAAKIAIRDFVVNNFDMKTIVRRAATSYSMIDMEKVIDKSLRSGQTKFDSVDAELNVKKGVARIRGAKINGQVARGKFSSEMRVKDWNIKAKTALVFKPKKNVRAIALHFDSDGFLYDMQTTVDTSSLEKYINRKAGN